MATHDGDGGRMSHDPLCMTQNTEINVNHHYGGASLSCCCRAAVIFAVNAAVTSKEYDRILGDCTEIPWANLAD
ncbi:MAG: hypothetical protein F6K09_05190 [Merismopedia sp. SIO2A8]|nr:hypothetical protein [Merismopedia sp. SIO2A8]